MGGASNLHCSFGKGSSEFHVARILEEMAVPEGFIGTIEDNDEIENVDIDSDDEEVSVGHQSITCTVKPV